MEMSRRTFLATTTAAVSAASVRGARAAERRYKAAIIADGPRGGYGHSIHLVFARRPDVDVVALADPYDDIREERAAEAGAQRVYSDYREMLETEELDLVAVAPRNTPKRVEHMTACAEHGCHGFVEKPLCSDLAEAGEIAGAIEANNLKWVIAHNFRATSIIAHARRMIFEDGLIGEVLEMRGRGKEDHRAGGEDLIVLGSHIFDLMGYFAGQPEWCSAHFTMENRPVTPDDVREATEPLGPIVGDRMQATYGYANGVYGSFASMRNADGDGDRWGLDIYGSQGAVSIRMANIPHVHVMTNAAWAPGPRGDAVWAPLPDAPDETMDDPRIDRYAPQIDELIAAIEEDREPAISVSQSGVDSVAMIQAAFESCVQGGPVAMPLERRDHPLKRWA